MNNEDLDLKILSTLNIKKEPEEVLTFDELLALPHPFEQNPELLVLVEQCFPGKNYVEQLLQSTRPTISKNPDQFEKWEAEVILRRKQKQPGDLGIEYLIRILYEETFSVRQFQGEKRGSEGTTLGGLLSHHYTLHSTDGVDMDSILDLELLGNSFGEEFARLIQINDRKALEKLTILATEIAYTNKYIMPGHAYRVRTHYLRTKQYTHSDPIEITSYRAMKIIRNNPSLLQKITDENLLDIFKIKTEQNLLFLLSRLWSILGHSPGVLFLEGGYYKHEITPQLLDGLEKLIQFRVNPQTQILYKYLSPSGYLNEFMNDKNSKEENF